MNKDLAVITSGASPLREYLIVRPRINELLAKASECKLVYVIAGAGYGKTVAVQHYINQQKNTVARWLQLTESDNIGSHYWENFTHAVALDNPGLAGDLQEFGFPETLVRFRQFADILKRKELHPGKTFLVLDDFHMINSKEAFTFAERCAGLHVPGACVIIISRVEPDINTMHMLSKGTAAIITQDNLCFADYEIEEFFKRQSLPCTSGNIEKLAESTKGWPLAVNLLSLAMKKSQANLDIALKLTTKNINRLFESEAWNTLPGSVQKTLVKLSLVYDLPLPLSHEIFGNAEAEKYLPELASFLSYDNFYCNYRIHPLYLGFLSDKQTLLTKKEKCRTYQKAAQWCMENSFFTGAVKYYAASHEYQRIFEAFRSYPGKLSHEAYKYFLEIIENAESEDSKKESPELSKLKALAIPFLLIGLRKFEQAQIFAAEAAAEWERSEAPCKTEVLLNLYNALAHICKYTCITTHEHNTAMYLEKVARLSEESDIIIESQGIFALPDIRSFACLVGESAVREEFAEFSGKVQRFALHCGSLTPKRYLGYDDWTACEIAFFMNNLDESSQRAHSGVMIARENNHYGIEMMLRQYMLRIAIHKGDYPLSKEILKQISECLEKADKFRKQLLYDLITGSFYIHIGVPGMVAPWILSESDKDDATDLRIPMRELIVRVRYFLARKKYAWALALLTGSYPRLPHERFLFSELILTILLSIVQMKTGDTESAVKSFEKAYTLSYDGIYEMPFIEMGRYFAQISKALNDKNNKIIPAIWLSTMERKATIYRKNTAVIENAFKHENKIENKIALSERERDVLSDMCRGFSRDEIAQSRYLSLNTVKKIMQSLYIKLDASNNLDAVRIAFERRLLD